MRISDWSSDVCSSDLQSLIEKKWPGKLVFRKKLRHIDGLTYQEVPQQRRCSFYYDNDLALDEVKKVADQYNCDVLLSAGKDRKSVVWGKRVSVRVDLGGRRIIKKKKNKKIEIK